MGLTAPITFSGMTELALQLSTPSQRLVEDLRGLKGDIVVLGAAGKLGPSLVELAVRGVRDAGTNARVYAVSRFSDPGQADEIAATGAQVVRADVSDPAVLSGLPDAANVIFLIGAKFGTAGGEHRTWATNCYLPGRVAERYAGSRIAALSTGNVYPLVPVDSGGCREGDPVAPVGEYAMSCLGRERVFQYFADHDQTPVALIRLNYAVEMRYGILVDIASKINSGEPIDVTMGAVNVVWQRYANEVTLRSLLRASVPPFVLNVTGPETLRVRDLACRLGRFLGREPVLSGTEAATALLSDARRCQELFGPPELLAEDLLVATADWVRAGRTVYGKPTHYDVRDGRF